MATTYRVIVDRSVPARDAELIAGVPPELLPEPTGPVPDRPAWAGRPPRRFERGDSYRWLQYKDGYRAAARHRGRYRIEPLAPLSAQLQPLQDRMDAVLAVAKKARDPQIRTVLGAEVQAVAELLTRHATLSGQKPLPEDTSKASREFYAARSAALDAVLGAVEARIRRMEEVAEVSRRADQAQQLADALPTAENHNDEVLDLLARATAGSLAADLDRLATLEQFRLTHAIEDAESRAAATALAITPPAAASSLGDRAAALAADIHSLAEEAPAPLRDVAWRIDNWLSSTGRAPTPDAGGSACG